MIKFPRVIFSHARMESFATHQVKKNVLLFMNCFIQSATGAQHPRRRDHDGGGTGVKGGAWPRRTMRTPLASSQLESRAGIPRISPKQAPASFHRSTEFSHGLLEFCTRSLLDGSLSLSSWQDADRLLLRTDLNAWREIYRSSRKVTELETDRLLIREVRALYGDAFCRYMQPEHYWRHSPISVHTRKCHFAGQRCSCRRGPPWAFLARFPP
jgi:hypothetical protein